MKVTYALVAALMAFQASALFDNTQSSSTTDVDQTGGAGGGASSSNTGGNGGTGPSNVSAHSEWLMFPFLHILSL